jgi:hypothetical protein
MCLATLLTPFVICRKYLPLHPVAGTCDHVWMSFCCCPLRLSQFHRPCNCYGKGCKYGGRRSKSSAPKVHPWCLVTENTRQLPSTRSDLLLCPCAVTCGWRCRTGGRLKVPIHVRVRESTHACVVKYIRAWLPRQASRGGLASLTRTWMVTLRVRSHRKRVAAVGGPSREIAAVCDLVTLDRGGS